MPGAKAASPPGRGAPKPRPVHGTTSGRQAASRAVALSRPRRGAFAFARGATEDAWTHHGARVDFRFLLAFAAALLGAKLLGELAERLGQPAVLGELLAGVVLGPSVLGLVPLSGGIFLLAEIGVMLLLFEVGLETDMGELLTVGAPALAVALVGMALPFLGGYLLTRASDLRASTAVFVGAALTATSIGITAASSRS